MRALTLSDKLRAPQRGAPTWKASPGRAGLKDAVQRPMAHPLVHWELLVTNTERARAFYGRVFEWTFDDKTYPGYTLIRTGRDGDAGLMASRATSPVAGSSTYFEVTDLRRTLANVTEAGGTVIVPATAIPNLGTFAMFQDPEGVAVGVLQPLGR